MTTEPTDSEIAELQDAIGEQEGCDATWRESVPLTYTSDTATPWDGVVHVFDLAGHAEAHRAYGWIDGKELREPRIRLVLEKPPITSPETAVRAMAEAEYRAEPGST